MTVRVAVVDDQALMCTGFSMILGAEADIEVVGDADNGRSGVELCRRERPDVVLMDIRMPDLDGIEATRIIVDDPALDTRVLVLTTFDLDEYVYGAVRAGASGFLLKDTPADELVRAIHVVARGEALLAPSITRTLIEEFVRHGDAPISRLDLVDPLTDRETEVLRLMACGMSNSEIAEALFVGETTVKTHVSRVLMKLGVRDRVQAVVVAYETGLVRPGNCD
jgi:DNA-binding NarL/FixJ family response regulator